MIKKYWNNFNMVTKDHFYHSGGKIENRNSIVEALVFNFETDIYNHNYEPLEHEIQFTLFSKSAKYSVRNSEKSGHIA
jgi:DNA adenine methylase